METLWFMIVAVMVAAYVVLDGFDLGAGAIYLGVARTSDDRRRILRAIGPVWDGNEVRGVPLGPDGYFFEPLWTNFRASGTTGILDWYTVLTGVIALVTLTAHGALYIAVKTEGELNRRARAVALWAWPLQVVLTIVGLAASCYVQPIALDNYKHHAIGFLIPVIVFG